MTNGTQAFLETLKDAEIWEAYAFTIQQLKKRNLMGTQSKKR
jgi:hypothetical protein